jgi:hypothetical protein
MQKSPPHPRSSKTPTGGRMTARIILQMSLLETCISNEFNGKRPELSTQYSLGGKWATPNGMTLSPGTPASRVACSLPRGERHVGCCDWLFVTEGSLSSWDLVNGDSFWEILITVGSCIGREKSRRVHGTGGRG